MDKKAVFTIDTDLLTQFLNKNDSSLQSSSNNYYDDPDYHPDYPGYMVPGN